MKKKSIKKVYVCEDLETKSPIFIPVDSDKQFPQYKPNFKQELFKSLFLSQEAVSNSLNSDSSLSNSLCNFIDPPYNPDQLALLLTLNSVHYRCCKVKSTDITAQGYSLPFNNSFAMGEEDFSQEEKDLVSEQSIQVTELLKKLEDGLGQEELINKIGLEYESIGYFACEVLRNIDGEILNVKHLPARSIRVANKDGIKYYYQVVNENKQIFVPYGTKFNFEVPDYDEENYTSKVKAYTEREVRSIRLVKLETNSDIDDNVLIKGGEEFTQEEIDLFKESATELLFVTQSHPATDTYGIPEVIPALASINGNISIDDYLTQFFENNAIPQYMIIIEGTDEVDDEVVKSVTKFFKDNIKGSNHATLIFPVPEGVKVTVKALSAEQREGSFQKTRENNRDDILVAHGMTPAQVGIIDTANLGSGSGLSQAENYKNRVLGPRQRMYENRLINKLIGEEGQGLLAVVLKYNTLDITDYKILREVHETYLSKGVLSINEVRRDLGKEDIEGGDLPFIILSNEIVLVKDIDKKAKETEEFEKDLTSKLREVMKRVLDK